jgi:23S rRNA (adenine2030-N6)-methyltransferase
MLSYRHVYHAGNPADVHKHLALVTLLRHKRQKEKLFCFVDAHAGRGLYDLESPEARRTGEAEDGVLHLALAGGAPRNMYRKRRRRIALLKCRQGCGRRP